MLPTVTIKFDNGTIGTLAPSTDGIFGVVAEITKESLQPEVAQNTPFFIRKSEDLSTYIVVGSIGSYRLEKFVQEFYSESANGQKLWIIPTDSDAFSGFPDKNKPEKSAAEIMMDTSNGEIKGVFSVKTETPVYSNGLPFADSLNPTFSGALLLAERQLKKATPIFVIIEGYGFTGELTSLESMPSNTGWVGVMIGDVVPRTTKYTSYGAALGLLAGRLSKNKVHINIGRVYEGAITQEKAYVIDTLPEQFDIETLAEKRYITLRTHIGKSGYYFSDDPLMSPTKDDYGYITRRRVINKVYRVAYTALTDTLLDDIRSDPDGTMDTIYARTLEAKIEDTIAEEMTANGELSFNPSDKDDKGVKVKVNTENNFLATSKIELTIRVRPHGYARYIDVLLGYLTKNTTDVNI